MSDTDESIVEQNFELVNEELKNIWESMEGQELTRKGFKSTILSKFALLKMLNRKMYNIYNESKENYYKQREAYELKLMEYNNSLYQKLKTNKAIAINRDLNQIIESIGENLEKKISFEELEKLANQNENKLKLVLEEELEKRKRMNDSLADLKAKKLKLLEKNKQTKREWKKIRKDIDVINKVFKATPEVEKILQNQIPKKE